MTGIEVRFPGFTDWFSPDGAEWLFHPHGWDLTFRYHPEMERVGLARIGTMLLTEGRAGAVTYQAKGLLVCGGAEFVVKGTIDVTRIEDCGVCWGSHGCGLPARHDGDHVCGQVDDPCESVPRSGIDASGFAWSLYLVDLLRYDGEFCDLCGPIERAPHDNAALDHAMRAHPQRWADEYAADYRDYLGNGQWGAPL